MKPGTLKYKTKEVYLNHATKEHDKTLSEVEHWIIETFGMLVTESYRPQLHQHDLHGTDPVRAKDIRSRCYSTPEDVAEAINKKWQYDPSRPRKLVAVYHDSGQGPHIHLQTHPNTIKIMED